MRQVGLLCVLVALAVPAVHAQRAKSDSTAQPPTQPGGSELFGPNDAPLLIGAIFASIEVAHYDTKIAHYTQSMSVQGDSNRLRFVKSLTKANETTLTVAALLGYGLGRITHSTTVTDVSAHVGEALVITSVVSQAIRGPFGRARPYVTHDDQNSDFHVKKGFTSYDYRSFPSLHSSTAFAAAAAITEEVKERHPGAAWPVGIILYSTALIPGVTRMYLDQHWASDVAFGAFLGAFIGNKVVEHAHSNPRNKLDRFLLGATIVPEGHGVVTFSWTTPAP